MIPPKLVKIAVLFLCGPSSKAIDNSLLQGVFSDDAKTVLVSPLDQRTSKKNEISNFSFSKVYEKFAKMFLEADMNKFLSPLLSAYRKNYSTQHVLICLAGEWRERLNNNYVEGSVFMDLSKAFDCIAKLDAYGFNRNLVRYIYSYL